MRFAKATFVSLLVLGFAVSPAHAFPLVNFEATTQSDWDDLLAGGPITPSVSPVGPAEWSMIPVVQQNNMGPGVFVESSLNSFDPVGLYDLPGDGGGPFDLEGPGLVMSWGDTAGDFIGGWEYDYGEDPNVSGATIGVTLFAPQFGLFGQINSVTFGLQSPNPAGGRFTRSWTWTLGVLPTDLPWNVGNPISIQVTPLGAGGILDAMGTDGITFANVAPAAWGDSGFDPTKAQWFVAFENAMWAGTSPLAPPGQAQPAAWNYWRNLSVSGGAPPIPEPGVASMLGLGLLGMAARRRRK